MGNKIIVIPVGVDNNKLILKDFEIRDNKFFVKYKSTLNDIPFMETEIYPIDGNFVITSDNGTILYRFSPHWFGLEFKTK